MSPRHLWGATAPLLHAAIVGLIIVLVVPVLWAAGAVLWIGMACKFVIELPRLFWLGWEDWRFCKKATPLVRSSLPAAVWIQVRIWAKEAGLR